MSAAAALVLSDLVLHAAGGAFYTTELKPGLQLIASPFETPDNAVFQMFRTLPNGAVFKVTVPVDASARYYRLRSAG